MMKVKKCSLDIKYKSAEQYNLSDLQCKKKNKLI